MINETKLKIKIINEPIFKSVQTSILNVNFNNVWDDFKYLIYLSLDSEYNSRISQLYNYLEQFNTTNKEILMNKLLNSDIYSSYKKLDNFNPELFLIKSNLLIGKKATIVELNKLNESFLNEKVNELNGYKFIKLINEENILNYLKKWGKLFKVKNKKHLDKISILVDKVIEDLKKPLKERFNYQLQQEINFKKNLKSVFN